MSPHLVKLLYDLCPRMWRDVWDDPTRLRVGDGWWGLLHSMTVQLKEEITMSRLNRVRELAVHRGLRRVDGRGDYVALYRALERHKGKSLYPKIDINDAEELTAKWAAVGEGYVNGQLKIIVPDGTPWPIVTRVDSSDRSPHMPAMRVVVRYPERGHLHGNSVRRISTVLTTIGRAAGYQCEECGCAIHGGQVGTGSGNRWYRPFVGSTTGALSGAVWSTLCTVCGTLETFVEGEVPGYDGRQDSVEEEQA